MRVIRRDTWVTQTTATTAAGQLSHPSRALA